MSDKKTPVKDHAKRAVKIAMRVSGQIRPSEAMALYTMARRMGNIVEIGCLHGRSTAALVQAAKVFKARVTSVDPFYLTPNTKQISSAANWRKNLRAVGLEAPKLMEMESHQAAQIYKDEIAFLFIDGNHDYAHVKQDIEDWSPKVKVGGVMAFHDFLMPHIDGVAKAVLEWWLSIFDIKNVTWKMATDTSTDYVIAFRRVK